MTSNAAQIRTEATLTTEHPADPSSRVTREVTSARNALSSHPTRLTDDATDRAADAANHTARHPRTARDSVADHTRR